MSDAETQPKPVLVVGLEELFYELVQQLHADDYRIDFAADAREADAAIQAASPVLLAVPWSDVVMRPSPYLGRAVAGGCRVLAVDAGPTPAEAEWPTALVDRAAGLGDRETLLRETLELLGERRQRARVDASLPLRLGTLGSGEIRDLSATSLLVETTALLEAGQQLDVELEVGRQRVTAAARVLRALGGTPPQVVLQLDTRDPAVVTFDRLVRRTLEVAHYERIDPAAGTLQGPVAWQLARRAERAMRHSRELRGLGTPASRPDPALGGLEGRYLIGARRGRWGVGDVYHAEERLRGRPVTLKRLPPGLHQDWPARARLEMEARVGSALADLDGVAGVLDFGSDGEGGLYYAMEPLEGVLLSEGLRNGQRFGDREVARLGAHLAYTLHEAAARDFHHGAIEPESVFLQRAEHGTVRPVLLAFLADLDAAEPADGPGEGSPGLGGHVPDATAREARDARQLAALLAGLLAPEPEPELGVSPNEDGEAEEKAAEPHLGLRRIASAPPAALLELALALRGASDGLDAQITGPPALVAELPEWPETAPRPAGGAGDDARYEMPTATGEEPSWEDVLPASASEPAAAAASEVVPATTAKGSRRWGRRLASSGVVAVAGLAVVYIFGSPWGAPSPLASGGSWSRARAATAPSSPPAREGSHGAPGSAASAPPVCRMKASAPGSGAAAGTTTESAPLACEPPPAEPATPATPLPPGAPPEPEPEGTQAKGSSTPGAHPAATRLSLAERRRAYLRLGRWLLDHGSILRARHYLTKALKHGDGAELRWLFTRSYQDTGEPWPAIWHLRKAIAFAPRNARYHETLGQLYLQAGHRDTACVALLGALARQPDRRIAARLHQQHCGPVRTSAR